MLCCMSISATTLSFFFFFNDTATTEIYTLSLHDALPICCSGKAQRTLRSSDHRERHGVAGSAWRRDADRKSTRLNSSHLVISYAVFCLKKKNTAYTTCALFSQTVTPRGVRSTASE